MVEGVCESLSKNAKKFIEQMNRPTS